MASSEIDPSGKIIVDSIHRDIHLTDREVDAIDTASFQRLRRLKQLQMNQVTYPNATHTRFSHSLGTLAIMSRIIEVAKKELKLSKSERKNLRLAALLHDIGHYPYSHLMEGIDSVVLTEEFVGKTKVLDRTFTPYPTHVAIGQLIITTQKDLIKAIGSKRSANIVSGLFSETQTKNLRLGKLINSSWDLDRMDYMLRDSHAAGVPYGNIDINYLLNNLRVSPHGVLGFSKKAMPAVEHFLLARFFLYQTVYYHKTTFGLEEACKQLLLRIRRGSNAEHYGIPTDGKAVENLVTSPKLLNFTDSYVDNIVQQAAGDDSHIIKALAKSIRSRRPPKLLHEVPVCELKKSEQDHRGTTFTLKCRYNLKRLAEKYDIPLGQFLFCRTRPLRMESRGQFITEAEARQLPSEEEEKIVKIFFHGENEPRSLVSIEDSIVSKCADYFWQAFRLYVVCDDDDKVDQLRKEVKSW